MTTQLLLCRLAAMPRADGLIADDRGENPSSGACFRVDYRVSTLNFTHTSQHQTLFAYNTKQHITKVFD